MYYYKYIKYKYKYLSLINKIYEGGSDIKKITTSIPSKKMLSKKIISDIKSIINELCNNELDNNELDDNIFKLITKILNVNHSNISLTSLCNLLNNKSLDNKSPELLKQLFNNINNLLSYIKEKREKEKREKDKNIKKIRIKDVIDAINK